MVYMHILKQLNGLKLLRIKPTGAMHIRVIGYHSAEDSSYVDDNFDEQFSSEWYPKAFLKLKKWTHMLKNLDMIDGKLVDVTQNARIFDEKLVKKMLILKSVARIFIGHRSMQQSIRNNMMSGMDLDDLKYESPPFIFTRPKERLPMEVDSLKKVLSYINTTVPQRKVVRLQICQQVTHYHVWVRTLEEILNRLKSEIAVVPDDCSSKQFRLAEQIVVSCLKILESVTSYDPESTSWMLLVPKATIPIDDSPPYKWTDVVQMFEDLINCLGKEYKDFALHAEKLQAMKEGLHQISYFSIEKNIAYKANRYKESLVQKQLTKSLGYSSRCLYTLLLYYLFGIVNDLEVDICGAVYRGSRNRYYLCMGKILTSTEEKVLENGMKQLDRALTLFKFVWETAEMKGDIVVQQGHLWCVGADNKSLSYRGHLFFLHDLSL